MVTSAGVTLGELPLTRQQHSIARSASGPSLVMMAKTGAAGSSRGAEAGELPELSSIRTVGGCVPIYHVPAARVVDSAHNLTAQFLKLAVAWLGG